MLSTVRRRRVDVAHGPYVRVARQHATAVRRSSTAVQPTVLANVRQAGQPCGVRRLTIEASSLASARGFYAALTGFKVELELTSDDRYIVTVGIRNDADVVRVLQALERHAEARRRS
jgi:hypothetical protein